MPLLRFDPSGSINADFGVTEEQIAGLSGILAELRTEIVEIDPKQYQSGQVPANKQPLDAHFFWLPEE